MTSEILIMTNDAIVMGADSAVTINDRKTHTGANKLFGLSNKPPMAMMIFGTADFGSVSLESLIDDYKNQTDFEELGNILKIKKSFIDYLNNVPYDFTDFELKLELFKEDLLNKIEHMSEKEFSKLLNDYNEKKTLPFLENNSFLDTELENIRKELNDVDISVEDLRKYFNEMLIDSSAGVVIAGFNKNKFKPSYIYFELITKYEEEIIISNSEAYIDCGRNFIFSFAQKDVVETFVSGVNDDFIDFLEYCIYNCCSACLNAGIEYFIENGALDVESVKNHTEKIEEIKDISAEEGIDSIKNFKEYYGEIISDGVGSVPIEVLVTIVEDMIETTSLKRKLDSDLDTVGGDIDIIIITSKGLTYECKIDYNKKKCCNNKEKS